MHYMPYTYQNPYYANVPAHTYGNPTGYWAHSMIWHSVLTGHFMVTAETY